MFWGTLTQHVSALFWHILLSPSHLVLCHIFTWSLCVLTCPLSHIHVVLVCHSRSSVTYSRGPCVSSQVLCHIFTWSLCVIPGPLSHSCGPYVSFQVLCHIFTWSLYVLPGPLSHIHVVLVCPVRSSVTYSHGPCVSCQVLCSRR